jgi:hypothetical protein
LSFVRRGSPGLADVGQRTRHGAGVAPATAPIAINESGLKQNAKVLRKAPRVTFKRQTGVILDITLTEISGVQLRRIVVGFNSYALEIQHRTAVLQRRSEGCPLWAFSGDLLSGARESLIEAEPLTTVSAGNEIQLERLG